jgi:hypothetical protein
LSCLSSIHIFNTASANGVSSSSETCNKEEGMYADSNQCRVIFEAFHVSYSTALIGREGHHNIPALGQDTDRALRVAEEDVARRRAQTGNVRILQTVSFLRTGECGGVTLKMSVFLSASEPSVRVSKKLKCLHCTGGLEGTRIGGGATLERDIRGTMVVTDKVYLAICKSRCFTCLTISNQSSHENSDITPARSRRRAKKTRLMKAENRCISFMYCIPSYNTSASSNKTLNGPPNN